MSPGPEQVQQLIPLAIAWATEQESHILASGLPLTTEQRADALRAGVLEPDRVRILRVPQVPMPNEPTLRAAALATGLLSPDLVGLTLRYGIYLHERIRGRSMIAHELMHTAQYERLGGFQGFMERYIPEVLTHGYSSSPLEREAQAFERSIWVEHDIA